jgi:hypothetical protein
MGSFGGHALPGGFFIAFSIYWSFMFYRRLFASMRKGAPPFRATVTFRLDGCGRRCANIEWEGVLKIFFTLVGFAGEVITAHHGGRFTHTANGQHATMFFFFGLSGVVDILAQRGSPLLPRGSSYFFGLLAFAVEAVLFAFHLHGRTTMDVLVHTLLIYVLYASIVIIALEAYFRNAILVFARILIVMVQGTWFWQVGFILYLPMPGSDHWDEEDHGQMMIIVMMFCWHIAACLTVMLTIGAVVYFTSFRSEHYELMADRDPEDACGRSRRPAAVAASGVHEYHDDDELDSDVEHVFLKKVVTTAN